MFDNDIDGGDEDYDTDYAGHHDDDDEGDDGENNVVTRCRSHVTVTARC